MYIFLDCSIDSLDFLSLSFVNVAKDCSPKNFAVLYSVTVTQYFA